MTDIGGDRFGPWDTNESTYAWLIHKDYLASAERDEKGIMGPRNAPKHLIERLLAGEGRKFKMYDDDGELYYDGKIVGVDDTDDIFLGSTSAGGDEADFGPLWDFGEPNAGATEIRYKNEEGTWQTL